MSSEQTFNHKKSRKTRKNDKVNLNKEKNDREAKEEQSQKMKIPGPIIYDPDRKQENTLLPDYINNFKKDQERINSEAKEITNYYLELHKNMINTYNSVYSKILQNSSGLSWDVFFTDAVRLTNYPFDIKNMYTRLVSNRDESLKLIDNIITENLDTFIKSIELTQRFYKDIIQSYLSCRKQVK
ncbi:MAG TPA: hypothetical protein VE595_02815 [Nitrososphaeraceae archaeon]|nr:hypothetical protein [Nitrososphaeraceae archaeon]